MRTADDFNEFYAIPDPWRISRAAFRDRALARVVEPLVAGRRVLELGCGEGHLTRSVFRSAEHVFGIDISDVAINRARALDLTNARFDCRDFMDMSFRGFDVIAAIECINYLSPSERQAFFAIVRREHTGIMVMTNPIIGGKYWKHAELLAMFAANGLRLIGWRNIYPRQTGLARPIDLAIRYSGFPGLLDWLPTALVYQRAYILEV